MTDTLTAEELGLWRDFLRWSERTMAAVGADLASKSSLSVSDFEAMIRLQDAGGEMLQRELGDSLSWSASRLSHQLRRMEQRGLLSRSSAGHGRSVRVALTTLGRRDLAAAVAVHAHSVREHFLSVVDPSAASLIPHSDH
ncbi:MAG: MarR family transcriptional regulator [Microbacterium sp.]